MGGHQIEQYFFRVSEKFFCAQCRSGASQCRAKDKFWCDTKKTKGGQNGQIIEQSKTYISFFARIFCCVSNYFFSPGPRTRHWDPEKIYWVIEKTLFYLMSTHNGVFARFFFEWQQFFLKKSCFFEFGIFLGGAHGRKERTRAGKKLSEALVSSDKSSRSFRQSFFQISSTRLLK